MYPDACSDTDTLPRPIAMFISAMGPTADGKSHVPAEPKVDGLEFNETPQLESAGVSVYRLREAVEVAPRFDRGVCVVETNGAPLVLLSPPTLDEIGLCWRRGPSLHASLREALNPQR